MRGVFNLQPQVLRYKEIWDVCVVLSYLRQLFPARDLPHKRFTLKLCMLIALVSVQQVQTLQKLKIDFLTPKENSVSFCVKDLLKQSTPGNNGCVMKLHAYTPERQEN